MKRLTKIFARRVLPVLMSGVITAVGMTAVGTGTARASAVMQEAKALSRVPLQEPSRVPVQSQSQVMPTVPIQSPSQAATEASQQAPTQAPTEAPPQAQSQAPSQESHQDPSHGQAPSIRPRMHNGTMLLTIQTDEKDVTGDRKPDHIMLLGRKIDPSSPYFKRLVILVDNKSGKTVTLIPAIGGYYPKMQFCDFTGDKVNDILVSAETGGSGGTSDYTIASVKDGKPVILPVPKPLDIKGQLADGYKANITIVNMNQTVTVDLMDHKQTYDQAGVYKDGKLVKPVEVMVNSYGALKPVDLDRDGTCELVGTQRISGIANADTIAYATSVWKWDKDHWKLLKAEVKKTL